MQRSEAKNGIASASIATIELGAITNDMVNVTVHWELLNEDNEPMLDYDVNYSLGREDEHAHAPTLHNEMPVVVA